MGLIVIFSKNQKKQAIKTADSFEYKFALSKQGESKRRKTREEIIDDYKKIGNDILGDNYAGGSFVSSLD